ncbi:MAG: hypothetical protein IPL46_18775 [Saprospiraceae bacterium]|nr:hypothetical protein [Saprospiraceae bacterium]
MQLREPKHCSQLEDSKVLKVLSKRGSPLDAQPKRYAQAIQIKMKIKKLDDLINDGIDLLDEVFIIIIAIK